MCRASTVSAPEDEVETYCSRALCLTTGKVQLPHQALPRPAVKAWHLEEIIETRSSYTAIVTSVSTVGTGEESY